MRSSDPSELLDLERGLPTTAEDVAVLRRLRRARVSDVEYFAFLAGLPAASHAVLKDRRGPSGAPFRLTE